MAIRSLCAAGARAMATASGLVRWRGRSWRRSDALSSSRESVGWAKERSDVPTIHRIPSCEMVGTLRFAHPTASRYDADGSPLLRWNIPQARAMRRDILDAVFQMHPLVRRQLLRHAHAGPPFGDGPDRPPLKTAAAVRADIVQLVLDAISAERAFVGTDPRLHRTRRQVLVAIFAVRPELQRHGRL